MSDPCCIDELKAVGEVVSYSGSEVSIAVPTVQAPKVAGEILQKFPVDDISLEDVSMEQIVHDLFSGNGR